MSIPFAWLKDLCHHLPPEGPGPQKNGSRPEPPKQQIHGEKLSERSTAIINRYREYIMDTYAEGATTQEKTTKSQALVAEFEKLRTDGALSQDQYDVAMREISMLEAQIRSSATTSTSMSESQRRPPPPPSSEPRPPIPAGAPPEEGQLLLSPPPPPGPPPEGARMQVTESL